MVVVLVVLVVVVVVVVVVEAWWKWGAKAALAISVMALGLALLVAVTGVSLCAKRLVLRSGFSWIRSHKLWTKATGSMGLWVWKKRTVYVCV